MRTQPARFFRILLCVAFVSLLPARSLAQTSPAPTRITQAVDESQLTVLKGNTYFMARAQYDRGPAPASLPMNRMLLVLRRGPEQEAALEQLLDQQQDQSSPNYHQWLTPQQFGQQFGAADQDIQTVTSWLQSHGFQVTRISNGRTVIEFSGTAGQVQEALHTTIHKYAVPGANGIEEHWANSGDPQIPAALAPVVVGVATLHNFYKKPQYVLSNDKFSFERKPGELPQFTGTNGSGATVHAVGPGDLAVIYNANPLYTATPNINGTGSTIAVVARSNINIQDWNDFRSNFGIAGIALNVIINGTDPGNLGDGEEVEAILDASYSGALAPSALINFVVSASTNTTDGVDLSEMYIVDNNLGDAMTESFGSCEEGVTSAEATSISNLAEQAAAQGITYMVSAGDNGSAGCDDPNNPVATQGVSVNILASSPYTVAVGGTMFNDTANPATYWNSTNTSALVSARSYIPEDVWNESCSVSKCGATNANLFAGSGGVSTIFPKPAWQSGVAGIPATGNRNLPDVSLTAAGHDPYLICIEGSCQQGVFEGVAGTSASVQAFGGIMALVRQKIGSRAGQADYVFYKLAATETLANCNGSKTSGTPTANCMFYDTTVGNNIVPGITNGDYASTVGYDRASGLGSVNVANLVNQWSSATFAPSLTTLTVNPTTFTHGASATINITVAPQTGTPSFNNEDVSLFTGGGSLISDYTLSSAGTVSTSTNALAGGSYSLTAHYPGDGVLGSSASAPVAVTISPEQTTISGSALTGTPPGPLNPFTNGPYGTPVYLQGTIAGKSGYGAPTGNVTFVDSIAGSVGSATVSGAGNALTPDIATSVNAGSHSIVANYSGDASFLPGSSQAVQFVITQDPTTTAIQTPSSPIILGTGNSFSVNITANSYGLVPTGTLTLFAGNTQIFGPTQVLGDLYGGPTVLSLVYVPISVLPSGLSTLVAKYSGDSNYLASNSAPVSVSVVRGTTTTVTSSNPTVLLGTSVTLTAQVASNQPGGPAITGAVQFQVGGTSIGAAVPVSNGQAQITTTSLPAGTLEIQAVYSGDANYASSTNGVQEQVNGPDFSIAFSPALVNVSSPGATANTMLTVAGTNGYAGAITFSGASCAGLPSESSCSFSPATVTGSGSTTLTVSTTAPSVVVPGSQHLDLGSWRTTTVALRLILFGLALTALGIQTRRRRWNLVVTALVLTLLLVNAACGGGGGGGVKNPGTPMVQNQTVTVTATSGTTTHTFTFTLNVN
jgi:Pro-kumamolisin, activation domain/Bacterial Ig-like domain (group 3)